MLSGEATNTNFIIFDCQTDQGSKPQSTALEASMLTITPPMWLYFIWNKLCNYHHNITEILLKASLNTITLLPLNFELNISTYSGSESPVSSLSLSKLKLELWYLTEWYPRLQYYDVQTLEYRYISKLPMKNERIWSYVKETTSHLQNKLTKNIHLGVATRSSTKWDCLKPIRLHQYTWGLQHFLTFLQEDIGHIKCY